MLLTSGRRLCEIVLAGLILGVLFSVPVSMPRAQTPDHQGPKILTVAGGGIRDPLYITKVSVAGYEMLLGSPLGLHPNGNLIFSGRPFQAGSEWLGSMTVYLRNRTVKNIVFVDIPVGFPETGDGHTSPQSIYHIRLGRLPAVDAFDGRTGKPLLPHTGVQQLSIATGGTLAIRIVDYMDQLKSYVDQAMPFATVTKCTIYGTKGCFEDGTCWAGDSFSAPDPSHPGKFKPLGPDYFPGDPHQYWPPGS